MRNALSSRTLTVAALLTTLALLISGCSSAGASSGTAQAGQSASEDPAKDWASDAVLVGIFGWEGASAGDWDEAPWEGADIEEARAFMEKNSMDSEIGDGKCEVWAYVYTSASKPGSAYIVFVNRDQDREGSFQIPVDDDMEDLEPIGDYSIDSDQALQIAKDKNANISMAQNDENGFVALILANSPEYDPPVWVVTAGTQDEQANEDSFGFVVLDARSGSIIFDSSSFGGFGGFGGF